MGIDEDFALALALEQSDEIEAPFEKDRERVRPFKKPPETTSLADPSWEMVDPTPDIFALFIAFDLRFFWGKLKSVVIRWSKRMYSCAGICTYTGRCGLCTISLSEPLLKLRPRKDLVETLLHEMIHAFLFVTHNNKDRAAHGPEFHKHMYRINAEAGVNITVYHSFHDEVDLYKTHVWRCNGPCRSKAPYFGTVKRSSNRAPGPSEIWWKEHQTNCGGTWEKIKEPESFKKKQVIKKPASNVRGMGDITKFINNKNTGTTSNRGGTLVITKPPATQTKTNNNNKDKDKPSTSKKPPAGYNTIADYMNKTDTPKRTTNINKENNTNLTKPFRSSIPSGNLLNVKGFKDLNSGDIKKPVPVFSGYGNTIGASKSNSGDKSKVESQKDIKNTVRNHWANKFGESSGNSPHKKDLLNKRRKLLDGYIENKDTDYEINKRKTTSNENNDVIIIDATNSVSSKPIIIDDNDTETNNTIKNKSSETNDVIVITDDIFEAGSSNNHADEKKVRCPICEKLVYEKYINEHLDSCVITGSTDLQNDVILISEFSGTDDLVDDFLNKSSEAHLVHCPMCNAKMNSDNLSEHLENCDKIDFSQNKVTHNVDSVDEIDMLKQIGYSDEEISVYLKNIKKKETTKNVVTSNVTNSNGGISNIVQNIDQDYLNESVNVNFIGTQVIEDDENEDYLGDLSQNNEIELNDFLCPSCYKGVSLEDMNSHLDECLQS